MHLGTLKLKQSERWYLRIQGGCTELFRKNTCPKARQTDKRSHIVEFSRQARMRMLRTCAKIHWSSVKRAILVTLTYPDSLGKRSVKDRARDRYVFLRYVEKHMDRKIGVIWRVEWKRRRSGAFVGQVRPHVHLLLFDVSFIDHRLIRRWWRKILHVKGPLATDVRNAKSGQQAAYYMTKYIAKRLSLDKGAYRNKPTLDGRHWGVTRKSLVPVCPVEVFRVLTKEEAIAMRHMAAAACAWYHAEFGGGFTFLGPMGKAAVLGVLGENVLTAC